MSEQEIVTSIADRLKASGDVKIAFGEPQVIEGKTIVPVATVAYGFGGGTRRRPAGRGPRRWRRPARQAAGRAGDHAREHALRARRERHPPGHDGDHGVGVHRLDADARVPQAEVRDRSHYRTLRGAALSQIGARESDSRSMCAGLCRTIHGAVPPLPVTLSEAKGLGPVGRRPAPSPDSSPCGLGMTDNV